MTLCLVISPHGRLLLEESADLSASDLPAAQAQRITTAFSLSPAAGLLHLATVELQSALSAPFAFARDFAGTYLTRLCHTPALEGGDVPEIAPPGPEELTMLSFQAPPMKGMEYLNAEALLAWWTDLDALVRSELRACTGGVQAYLRDKNPLWRLVGRVTFHLAENKRDPANPFAFMATYAKRLSAQAKLQHLPLARALEEYAGAKNRPALLSLLTPIQRAAEHNELAKQLVESGDVYHPLAWSPREAFQFLQAIPIFEESGIVVRVPDWWKARRPSRAIVSVKIGDKRKNTLGVDAMLDFSVGVTVDGQPLTEAELQAILTSSGGLVPLRGQWVEVDREKLAEALDHWKTVEQQSREDGISFFQGMRLLAGANLGEGQAEVAAEETHAWAGVTPGKWLEETLAELRNPQSVLQEAPADLHAQLRPYQRVGMSWLSFMTRLGLGACLADDMGLGKTIQVLAMLLHMKRAGDHHRTDKNVYPTEARAPSLLVAPASLIANWKAEIAQFAPSLSVFIAHPSEQEMPTEGAPPEAALAGRDLLITTYGMILRQEWMRA